MVGKARMSDAPSEPPKKYEGPFRNRPRAARPSVSGWLTPWRLYAVGALAALGVTGAFILKLPATPEEVRRSMEAENPPPPPPPGTLLAYCLSKAGPRPMEPSPFCTEARPPSCTAGDAIQLTASVRDPAVRFILPAIVGDDFRAEALLPASRELRAPAQDAPIGQWAVVADGARRKVALVAMLSTQPIQKEELTPWFDAWKQA